jgi:hypothetical protein
MSGFPTTFPISAPPDAFLSGLSDVVADLSAMDLIAYLFRFRSEMFAAQFRKLPDAELKEVLANIWKLILAAVANPSSAIRLSGDRAAAAFLTRLLPYCPAAIHESFQDAALMTTIEITSSVVMASTFGVVSSYIAKAFLARAFHSLPVFHHFTSSDPSLSETIPIIISKLGHLRRDWLKDLLHFFLHRIGESSTRYMVKSVAAIVDHSPSLFLSEVIDFIGDNIASYLGLLAYVICTYQGATDELDLSKIAVASVNVIANPTSQPADLDSALQLLSVKSNSFHLEISELPDGMLHFEVSESAAGNLAFSRVSDRPAVYDIPLPYSLLVPGDDDSSSIIAAKFRTLGANDKFDPVGAFSHFEVWLRRPYSDVISGVIRAFALSVNRFLQSVPYERIYELLRATLFTKSRSWCHSDDILKVINEIDVKLLVSVLGEPFLMEVLEIVVMFCYHSNQEVSLNSIRILTKLTTKENCLKVVEILMNKGDLFDDLKLGRLLATFCEIFTKIKQKLPIIDLFVEQLTEIAWLFMEDLTLVSLIFQFFTVYPTHVSAIIPLLETARYICAVSVETVRGRPVAWGGAAPEMQALRQIVVEDILTRNVDILASPSRDYRGYLNPMRRALELLFSVKGKREEIARNCLRLLPFQCSRCFLKSWSHMTKESQTKLLLKIPKILHFIGEDDVHATWCQIYVEHEELFSDPDVKQTTDFLGKVATDLLLNSSHDRVDLDRIFSNFLLHTSDDVVLSFLRRSPPAAVVCYFDAHPSIIPFIERSSPELLENYRSRPTAPVEASVEESVAAELPSDLSQVQVAFETSVRRSDSELVGKIVDLAVSNKIQLDITKVTFPPSIIPIVATRLVKMPPSWFGPRSALDYVRTPWRQIALGRIEGHGDELIEQLNGQPKVHKATILDFCSLIGTTQFSSDLLLSFSLTLYCRSESARRFYLTLQLLYMAMTQVTAILPEFLTAFVATSNAHFDHLFGPLLSQICLVLARVATPTEEFRDMVNNAFLLCGSRTVPVARLHQCLFPIAPHGNLVSRDYLLKIHDLIQPLMSSVVPSRYSSGLRLVEQAAISVPPERCLVGLRTPIDIFADRFVRMSSFPPVIDCQNRVIAAVLAKSGVQLLHLQLFKLTPQLCISSDAAPWYSSAIKLWPTLLRAIPPRNDQYTRMTKYCESLLLSPCSFQIGIDCLREIVQKVKSERDKLVRPRLAEWLQQQKWNYGTTRRIDAWFGFVLEFTPSLLRFWATELVRKVAPFHVLYPSVAKLVTKGRRNQALLDVIGQAAMELRKACHRNAILLLAQCSDWKRLRQLAEFEDDCEAAERLVAAMSTRPN